MTIVSELSDKNNSVLVEEIARELGDLVETHQRQGSQLHVFEKDLRSRVQEMERRLTGYYLRSAGPGDEGEEVEIEGRRLKRSPEPERSVYLSIYGAVEFERYVYRRGEKQAIEYAPLEQRLGLPKERYSYLLQDWSQLLVAELAYPQARNILKRIVGVDLSVSALETITQAVSATVEPWCGEQQLPKEAQAKGDQVTVLSADGKGVVMRTESVERGLPARPAGRQEGQRKMALLGAAYTVEPWIRTPMQVLEALFGSGQAPPSVTPPAANDELAPRPIPLHKHVRAALSTQPLGEPGHASAVIFPWLAEQVRQRDPTASHLCVVLMDGQRSLWDQAETSLGRSDRIEILDLLHALGYLWEATHQFHPPSTAEAVRLMKVLTLALLQGQGLTALRWLRDEARLHGFPARQRAQLDKIWDYFYYHRDRIRYDQYLARGLPIASGVIEGACRHVVNDRLNRTGMRWSLRGAQAVLGLRCVAINGYWDEFMEDHIRRETERLYPHRDATTPVPKTPEVAAVAA